MIDSLRDNLDDELDLKLWSMRVTNDDVCACIVGEGLCGHWGCDRVDLWLW